VWNIILNELSKKTEPRVKWEEALPGYANAVVRQLYGDVSYPTDFFASQIEFIVENSRKGEELIDNWHLVRLLSLISEDSYKTLRHKISRHMILEDIEDRTRLYKIHSNDEWQATEIMLKDFPDDHDLTDRIKHLQTEYTEEQKVKSSDDWYCFVDWVIFLAQMC